MRPTMHKGKRVFLGKHAPKFDPRTLKMARYLVPSELPDTSAARDLTFGLPWDDDPLGNLDKPVCTCSALGHLVKLLQLTNNLPVTVTEGGVVDLYCRVTGVPLSQVAGSDGANMLDVLKAAKSGGVCGVRISAFVSFDPRDQVQVRAAVDLFGGGYYGYALPKEAMDQDVWDAVPGMVPGSEGGHAVERVAASPKLGVVNTWGERKPVTPAFDAACADEAYAVLLDGLPPPAGLDMDALTADLKLLH